MNFHALRQQPFASALATPRKGGAPGFRAHTRAKTVLILSSALRALQCSFHGVGCWGGATLGKGIALSIALVIVLMLDAFDYDYDYDYDYEHEHEHEGRRDIPHCHTGRFME
jgi:hypothetical protein